MQAELTPLFIPGGFGPMELGVILLLAILLFGANKIPKLARSTGEAMGEFQKGREKVESELEEMRESGEYDTSASGDDDDDEFVDTEPVTSEEETETN